MKPPQPYNPLFIPPILEDIEKLACGDPRAIENCQRIGRAPEDVLEDRLWISFRILGFEVIELGHKVVGRFPDGIGLAKRDHYAVIFDSKMRTEGYNIGTDDRAIIEYIERFYPQLEGEGMQSVYFSVISAKFTGNNKSHILRIRRETSVKNVTLLRTCLLLHLVELKLINPHIGTAHLEGIFLRSEEISEEDIERELSSHIRISIQTPFFERLIGRTLKGL